MAEDGAETTQTADFSFVVSVSAEPGEDVTLPVHLSPETSAVSMNISWYRGTELIYQYKNGMDSINSEYENQVSLSIQELERGNLSLTLRNVQESDSGNYTCHVYHDKCLKTVIVRLQVRGERQLQRLMMEQKRKIKKLKLEGQIMKQKLEGQIKKQKLEGQIMKQELEGQTRELEQEKQIQELEQEKQIQELEQEKQIQELEQEKQIQELEQEKQIQELEQEKQIQELEQEKQIEDLEKLMQELPLPTHALHGHTPRRRTSIDGIPPRMSEDTPETPKTEEESETSDTTVEGGSGDQNNTNRRREYCH